MASRATSCSRSARPTSSRWERRCPCFARLVANRDRSGLLAYATSLVETIYPLSVGFGRGITTVCLVKGTVLSTGIDLALSCHYLFAERTASFGLPELLYNGMPGVAAYALLARRVGARTAEAFLHQARVHRASELGDDGIVDRVVEEGEGERAVLEFLRSRQGTDGARVVLDRARNRYWHASRDELYDLARQWADTAAALEENDLRRLERYMRSQKRRWLEPGLTH